MISIRKLQSLPPSVRVRKIVTLLDGLVRYGTLPDAGYLRMLAREAERVAAEIVASVSPGVRPAPLPGAGHLLAALEGPADPEQVIRAVDALRHALRAASGVPAADWDLLPPAGYGPPASGRLGGPADRAPAIGGSHPASVEEAASGVEPTLPVSIYLESVRSPFNVGSIVRTAAAFGVCRVGLSPDCPPEDHRRVLRSAMGGERTVDIVRLPLSDLDDDWAPLIAVETGGTPVESFRFPGHGTLLAGSEELGLSREARQACSATVSVPLRGAKASLNVGVACGIVLYQWYAQLRAGSTRRRSRK